MNLSDQNPIEPELVEVPGGSFLMGITDRQIDQLAQNSDLAKKWRARGYFKREQPQHAVFLPAYSISKNPVTVAECRVFVGGGGYQHRRFWTDDGWLWRVRLNREWPEFWNQKKMSDFNLSKAVGQKS